MPDPGSEVRELIDEVRALRRENEDLRARFDAMEARVPASPALSAESDAAAPQGRESRRALLRRAGTVAVGGLAAVAATGLGGPRPARGGGGNVVLGSPNVSQSPTTIVWELSATPGVYGFAVKDHSLSAFPASAAISGHGNAAFPNGVFGFHAGNGIGVHGRSEGPSGSGVYGLATHATGIGVVGRGGDSAYGVHATSARTGIRAQGGRGGVFVGSKAQVRLVPTSATTHPTAGFRGDLYVDKNGRLWYCKTGGPSSVWIHLA